MSLRQDDLSKTVLDWGGPTTSVRGGSVIRLPSGRDYFVDDRERNRLMQLQQDRAGFRRNFNIARAVGIGLPLAAAAAPTLSGMFTGGGAASAGWSMPGVTAPTFGAPAAGAATAGAGAAATAGKVGLGARLGSMFNSAGMNLGVNTGLSLLGMRSQNKAADQARADMLAANREAIALQRQQLEIEARNADLDREEARRLNDAINELKKRELDAAEEERAFARGLVEQREARLAPYRQRSTQALDRLASMWRLG